MLSRLLLTICLVGLVASASAEEGVTLRGDKKYGECWGSDILTDFLKRYPPEESKFNLEIDFDKETGEVYIYYHNLDTHDGVIAFYDGQSCEFLRSGDRRQSDV